MNKLFIVLVLMLCSCSSNITGNLGTVKANYDNYKGWNTEIDGYIVSIFNIKAVPVKVYELYDLGDVAFLLSIRVPGYIKNDKIKVYGKVFYFGGRSMGSTTDSLWNNLALIIIDNNICEKTNALKMAKEAVDNVRDIIGDRDTYMIVVER